MEEIKYLGGKVTFMAGIFKIICDFFEAENWSFTEIEKQQVLSVNFTGQNGQWICYARVREEENQFICYSDFPVKVPEDKRLAMAEFLTRINYGLVIGNFEMDFEDGELHYKTGIDGGDDRLSQALVRQVVYRNMQTTDEYFPGMMAIISGDALPVEAVALIEG